MVQSSKFILLGFFCMFSASSFAQEMMQETVGTEYLAQVSGKAEHLSSKLDKQTEKLLQSLDRQEQRMRKKLQKLDSSRAQQVFSAAITGYGQMKSKLSGSKNLSGYIPYFDTLQTTLRFLQQHQQLLSAGGGAQELKNAMASVTRLEGSLAGAESVRKLVRERKAFLQQQLKDLPFTRELKKINKEIYYYTARVAEYKEALKDRKKMEQKVVELLRNTKWFREFMQEHSQLALLFRLPGGTGGAGTPALSQGLQTRVQVNQLIVDRIGNAAGAQAVFREQVQAGQSQLSRLKSGMQEFTSGSFGNSDEIEQPDFRPNNQKTRSFAQRIEYGGNIQSQRARHFFPLTTDIALSIGYKLNDKSVLGIGGSYKLGWGRSWSNMRISHQGLGLRSFLEYRLGSYLFISGGYEQNYRTAIRSLDALQDIAAWQQSGLIGLSRKYTISKKMNGSFQMLWDFLSYRQVPKTPAVLFRVGYSFR